MTGNKEIDNLMLFGLGGLIVIIVLILYFLFGVWKFYKTPKEQRGDNSTKVQYFILVMLLISFLTNLAKSQYKQISTTSFVLSVLFLSFMGYLFFIKKLKFILAQTLVLSAIALYSLFNIIIYLIK